MGRGLIFAVLCLLSAAVVYGRPINQDEGFFWLDTPMRNGSFSEFRPETVSIMSLSDRSNEAYQDPVKPYMFDKVPLKGYRGNGFVCWSDSPRFRGESVFGMCRQAPGNPKRIEAFFPWGGVNVKWPSTWSILLAKDVYWSSWATCPDSSPVNVKGVGSVSVKMDRYSDCTGWTVGKWKVDSYWTWFGCNGKEVYIKPWNMVPEDARVLCKDT